MTPNRLKATTAIMIVGGALGGIGLYAALTVFKIADGALSGLSALLGVMLGQSGRIVQHLFPGPEIDVLPPGATQADACTCGDKQEEPTP